MSCHFMRLRHSRSMSCHIYVMLFNLHCHGMRSHVISLTLSLPFISCHYNCHCRCKAERSCHAVGIVFVSHHVLLKPPRRLLPVFLFVCGKKKKHKKTNTNTCHVRYFRFGGRQHKIQCFTLVEKVAVFKSKRLRKYVQIYNKLNACALLLSPLITPEKKGLMLSNVC